MLLCYSATYVRLFIYAILRILLLRFTLLKHRRGVLKLNIYSYICYIYIMLYVILYMRIIIIAWLGSGDGREKAQRIVVKYVYRCIGRRYIYIAACCLASFAWCSEHAPRDARVYVYAPLARLAHVIYRFTPSHCVRRYPLRRYAAIFFFIITDVRRLFLLIVFAIARCIRFDLMICCCHCCRRHRCRRRRQRLRRLRFELRCARQVDGEPSFHHHQK